MDNLRSAFLRGKKLIAFVVAGYPSIQKSKGIIKEIAKSGADIIEVGFPFSDSVADGPVIVNAYQKAIANNVVICDCINLIAEIKKQINTPIVIMSSYSIVFNYGIEKFIKSVAKANADGLIIPDLPFEESKFVSQIAKNNGIDLVLLVAPNTSLQREKKIAVQSKGFIYLISTTGTTGIRKKLSATIKSNVLRLKKLTKKPIAVGFGISNPKQAGEITKYADAVIVGSAIVKRISENKPVSGFIKEMKKEINGKS